MSVEAVRLLKRLGWTLSLVALAAGFYVGMKVNAQVGAALWVASAVLALAPFASHRDDIH